MKTEHHMPTHICGYCGRARTSSVCECREVRRSRETRAGELCSRPPAGWTEVGSSTGHKLRSGERR